MNRTIGKIAVGSAFALCAGAALNGVASAAPGSLESGSLGSSLGSSTSGFTSPYTLHPHEPVKADNKCSRGENYSVNAKLWEINWGFQYTDQRFVAAEHWDSGDFGGLNYIDSQNSGQSPAEELEAIRDYEAIPEPKQAYHWWYTSRDMVEKGSDLTLGFEDGDVILGEVMVGSDQCPSVRWTHFPPEGEPVTTTPTSFPAGAPEPTKPVIPSGSPMGSLGSLFGS